VTRAGDQDRPGPPAPAGSGAVLRPDDIIPLLLEACPSFQPGWDEHLRSWKGEKRGHYIDTSPLAQHVVDRVEAGDMACARAALAVVERLLEHGDDETQTIAVVGILESLQNVAGNRGHDPEIFLPSLGPRTATEWENLNESWRNLAEKLAAERGAGDEDR
jgi:hypothetical protein